MMLKSAFFTVYVVAHILLPILTSVHGCGYIPLSRGPYIEGKFSDYRQGDIVKLTCKTGEAKPAPELQWYINDDRVITSECRKQLCLNPDSMYQFRSRYIQECQKLESSYQELSFQLTPQYVHDDKIILKCVDKYTNRTAKRTIYFEELRDPLRIEDLSFPNPVIVNSSVRLHCKYDLGKEMLLAIRWYKDDKIFFEYLPDSKPQFKHKKYSDVDVDIDRSDENSVYLRDVTFKSSGDYTCMGYSKAPYYTRSRKTKKLNVIALPGYTHVRVQELLFQSPVIAGRSIQLQCKYDLGNDTLLTVRWYKGYREFFGYYSRSKARFHYINLPGVDVVMSRSDENSVYLRNVTLESSGDYSCEVIGNAPYYARSRETKKLDVIMHPNKVPFIIEDQLEYRVGDNVSFTCLSGKAKPAPNLKWYINKEMASSNLTNYVITRDPLRKFEVSELSLNFVLEPEFVHNGKVLLTCVLTLRGMFPVIDIKEIRPMA